jgi:hypothetical protein
MLSEAKRLEVVAAAMPAVAEKRRASRRVSIGVRGMVFLSAGAELLG